MTNTLPLNERPHALYRFYDRHRALLYIGITACLPTRLTHHDDHKPWWTDVADITVQHFTGRDAVLDAEAKAIRTERPLHNVVHNRRPGSASPVQLLDSYDQPALLPGERQWTFDNLKHGNYKRTRPLWLYWEVHGDPISDDWAINDISPDELWQVWLTRTSRDVDAERHYGPGAVRIWWYVEGPGVFEFAPHQEHTEDVYAPANFLDHFTHPRGAEPWDLLQWTRLPVVDKIWRTHDLPDRYERKGGFIQEATGWKPSPLQPYVNVHQLARAARLYTPEWEHA